MYCIVTVFSVYLNTFFEIHIEYNAFLSVFNVAVREAIQSNKRLSALNEKQEDEICSLKKV